MLITRPVPTHLCFSEKEIPKDLALYIFKWLEVPDLAACRLTCQSWCFVSDQHLMPHAEKIALVAIGVGLGKRPIIRGYRRDTYSSIKHDVNLTAQALASCIQPFLNARLKDFARRLTLERGVKALIYLARAGYPEADFSLAGNIAKCVALQYGEFSAAVRVIKACADSDRRLAVQLFTLIPLDHVWYEQLFAFVMQGVSIPAVVQQFLDAGNLNQAQDYVKRNALTLRWEYEDQGCLESYVLTLARVEELDEAYRFVLICNTGSLTKLRSFCILYRESSRLGMQLFAQCVLSTLKAEVLCSLNS